MPFDELSAITCNARWQSLPFPHRLSQGMTQENTDSSSQSPSTVQAKYTFHIELCLFTEKYQRFKSSPWCIQSIYPDKLNRRPECQKSYLKITPFKGCAPIEDGTPAVHTSVHPTVGTHRLTEDDVSSQRQHQALGQAVGQLLKQHKRQGLLGSAHHLSHALLQGEDEGLQLFTPVLCGRMWSKNGGKMRKTEQTIIMRSELFPAPRIHEPLPQMSVGHDSRLPWTFAPDASCPRQWLFFNMGIPWMSIDDAIRFSLCWRQKFWWTSYRNLTIRSSLLLAWPI